MRMAVRKHSQEKNIEVEKGVIKQGASKIAKGEGRDQSARARLRKQVRKPKIGLFILLPLKAQLILLFFF